MIKNERQLRITKSKLEEFKEYLSLLVKSKKDSKMPELTAIEENAIRSQIKELEEQIEEYVSLWGSRTPIPILENFEEIPRALVKARISLGLSQKALAEKMGLKEQQIQRYEAEEYKSASLTRVSEFIRELNVSLSDKILLSTNGITFRDFLEKIRDAGLEPDFIINEMLPAKTKMEAQTKGKNHQINETGIMIAEYLSPIFGWAPSQIIGQEPIQIDMGNLGHTKFKTRKNTNKPLLMTQAFYTHYLALLVLQACNKLSTERLPQNPYEIHELIVKDDQSITPENTLRYIWGLGIPVLPLMYSGGLQGSHLKDGNRNVLVINNQKSYQARWLFVLFHELWHAIQHQDDSQQKILLLEDFQSMSTGKIDDEENIANKFAGAVLLGRNPNELIRMCVDEAQHDLVNLKQTVQRIGQRENVPVDVLANLVAFKLAEQGENWWGAANKLQTPSSQMHNIARTILIESIDPTLLTPSDFDLLSRALSRLEVNRHEHG